MQTLFSQCDFLFIQEHGLYASTLSWFHSLGDTKNGDPASVHGVSAMQEGVILRGRPRGGAAIVWHSRVHQNVTPVPCDSNRLCAVTVDVGADKLLLVCVYMPCDDAQANQNVLEYKDILDDICILGCSVNATLLCIGGDFNTDLSRNTPQTQALNHFTDDNELFCCARNDQMNFNFSYFSKINSCKTLIDHFIISDNSQDKLVDYASIDSVENPSDHVVLNVF